MPSIREQIIQAAMTVLNTAPPTGVPLAVRERVELFSADQLPAFTVGPEYRASATTYSENTAYEHMGKRSPFVKRTFTLRISAYVIGDSSVADPMLVWATSVLDGQFAPSLLEDCVERGMIWEPVTKAAEPYLAVYQDFDVHYHTVRGDQTNAGN